MKIYFLTATLAALLGSSSAGKCIDSSWPENDLTAHCEQDPYLPYVLSIQELQAPSGFAHSDGILDLLSESAETDDVDAAKLAGKAVGMIYFSNTLYVPGTTTKMGRQSGHCVQVDFAEESASLACYFNFNIEQKPGRLSGRITAEAHFDLPNFPNANLVITGGTGDFHGISGNGCTTKVQEGNPFFEKETFVYNFNYELLGQYKKTHQELPSMSGNGKHWTRGRGGK
jgi:hypothetical protein